MARRSPKSRNWIFTDNEEHHLWLDLPHAHVTYVVHQLEKGTHRHVQGYVQLSAPHTRQWCSNHLRSKARWEPARGSASDNLTYCTKEDTREPGTEPIVLGKPKQQGKRSDLAEFVADVKSGKRKMEMIELHPTKMARYPKFYDTIKLLTKPPKRSRKVVLLYGPPGTGKTHHVRSLHTDCYVAPLSKELWFDAYDGEDVVLFDDFNGNINMLHFLRLLHDWPEKVPFKGGFVNFNPALIYITSNYMPKDWYCWWRPGPRGDRRESLKALSRRIGTILVFKERGTLPKSISSKDSIWAEYFKAEIPFVLPPNEYEKAIN